MARLWLFIYLFKKKKLFGVWGGVEGNARPKQSIVTVVSKSVLVYSFNNQTWQIKYVKYMYVRAGWNCNVKCLPAWCRSIISLSMALIWECIWLEIATVGHPNRSAGDDYGYSLLYHQLIRVKHWTSMQPAYH